MAAWWQSLTLLEHVLLYIAVPATLILLIQTVLLFVGGVFDSDGGGGVESTIDLEDGGSFDADASADTDACHLDHVPGDDPTPHHAEASTAGLHIFTVRGVVAFLTLFGWGGLWLSQVGLQPALALFLAMDIGIAGMVLIALFIREATKLQYDGTLDIHNAVGQPGTVYLTIPAARTGTGKVTVTVQEQLREFEAITDSETPIPTGSPIQVAGFEKNGDLLVNPLTDPSV